MAAAELIRMLGRALRQLFGRWTARLGAAARRILGLPAVHDTPTEPPGPPPHWLRYVQREPPSHWLQHIAESAPHLLSEGHLNVPHAQAPSPPKARPRMVSDFRQPLARTLTGEEPSGESRLPDGREVASAPPQAARRAPALTDASEDDELHRREPAASAGERSPELTPAPGPGERGSPPVTEAAEFMASPLPTEPPLSPAAEADRWPTLAPHPLGSDSPRLEDDLRRRRRQTRLEREQKGLLWSE
jgi:hypothetical protein